jgi:hypothetical protein
VASLAEIAQKLRDLPDDDASHANVNWQPFDESRAAADAAAARGDFAAAIRQYCLAIRQTMKQLREQRPTDDAA